MEYDTFKLPRTILLQMVKLKRAVKIIKEALKKSSKDDSLETRISWFLFRYRLTPQSTTGVAPAELLLGRHPRSHLDLVKPDLSQSIKLLWEEEGKRG